MKKDKVKAAALLTAVEERDVSTDSAFMIEQVGAVHHNKEGQYFAKVEFISDSGKVALDCQLDTGATCSVITHRDVAIIQQKGELILKPSSTRLKFYDGSLLQALGEYTAQCIYGDQTHTLNFKVIHGDQKPL